MADTRTHPILNYLRQVLGAPAGGGVTDAELLHRFVKDRDEAAFELLLWRHGGMVVHVCRQMLGEGTAADDAFQATFLVFVRKAGSINRRESLGGWLYRVAYRIALKARAASKRQASADVELDRLEAPAEPDPAEQRELRRMICEEVDRLPAKYRAPIVACYFEARTHEEAAHQLGWPRGTVAGRLARARELLHRRLIRRGVSLTMGALAAGLSARTAQAALTRLIETTLQMAKLLAAGQPASAAVSPGVSALAEGVMKAMYWTRVKIVAILLLAVGLGGAGAAFWGAERGEDERPDESASPAVAAASDGRTEQPEDAAKVARNMALSRLNLKQMALAMHNYASTYGHLPAPAIYSKEGKALLSWRVALLPYLEQQGLYRQFHLDEPWDSPHNRKILETQAPKVYAPVGRPAAAPLRTYYQVFVSAIPRGRGAGGGPAPMGAMSGGRLGGATSPAPMGGSGGMGASPNTAGAPMGAGGGSAPGAADANWWITAAFVKGQVPRFPAHISDGTSNTILIVEAGNAVPWTKPEDLHYAADEPLPELGGLFRDVFQAAFADGAVHTLTKKYDEATLRAAITSNGGEPIDLAKLEAQPRRGRGTTDREDAALATWRRKNEELEREIERARQHLQLLKEERALQRELKEQRQPPDDPRLEELKRENARLQTELRKIQAESEALAAEINRLQQPQKKGR
jgi:RNA polymerase sigma factor (sigma-70 family)